MAPQRGGSSLPRIGLLVRQLIIVGGDFNASTPRARVYPYRAPDRNRDHSDYRLGGHPEPAQGADDDLRDGGDPDIAHSIFHVISALRRA